MVFMVHAQLAFNKWLVYSLPLPSWQWHLNQGSAAAVNRRADGIAQFSRVRRSHAFSTKSASKGHIVRRDQVCRNIVPVEVGGLAALHGGVGGIVKDDHNDIYFLLHGRGQFAHIEKDTAIAAQGHNGTLRRAYFGSQGRWKGAANGAEFGGVNVGTRLVHWEIDCAGVAKHGHIGYNHSLTRQSFAQPIKQRDSLSCGRSCIAANKASRANRASATTLTAAG